MKNLHAITDVPNVSGQKYIYVREQRLHDCTLISKMIKVKPILNTL